MIIDKQAPIPKQTPEICNEVESDLDSYVSSNSHKKNNIYNQRKAILE